jgi:type IV pilus assembly protein PilF
MMLNRYRRLVAAFAASLVVACATQETTTTELQPTDPNYGPVVGEPKDARTRAKAHTDLAAAYYELGNVGVALEEVRIAIAADANYAPAYNVQGLVNMDLRENGAAEASFQRGLKLAPQDPDLNHNYGWFLCQTGREDQSIPWFMNAVRSPLYPTPAKSFAAAGRCVQKRDPGEAMKYYDRALRIDPNNLQALLPYAEILYRRGQLRPAKELVGRYNKLVPEPTAESLWLALRIERKLGDQFAESSLATQLRRRYANSSEFQSLQRGNYD